MATVFWDSMLFIYSFEDNPLYADRVDEVLRRMVKRGDQPCTSALTVGEVQVKPIELGDLQLAETYRQAFRSPAITVIPFDHAAAESYARIRADRTISRPDAIQLACAASRKINL